MEELFQMTGKFLRAQKGMKSHSERPLGFGMGLLLSMVIKLLNLLALFYKAPITIMKRPYSIFISTALVFSLFLLGFGPSKNSNPLKRSESFSGRQILLDSNYGKLPLAFEPNQGQTDPQVKFLARGGGYNLFVTSQEAVLLFKKSKALSRSSPEKGLRLKGSPVPTPDITAPTVLRLKLEGAQADPVFEPLGQLPGISNYFIGKDPTYWHKNIPQYSKVAVRALYPGVDMVYYGNQGKLEYDFVVQPERTPRPFV